MSSPKTSPNSWRKFAEFLKLILHGGYHHQKCLVKNPCNFRMISKNPQVQSSDLVEDPPGLGLTNLITEEPDATRRVAS